MRNIFLSCEMLVSIKSLSKKLAFVFVIFIAAQPSEANWKSEKEVRFNLIGPVRTLQVNTVLFIKQNGKRVEGPRVRLYSFVFDESGNKIEETHYEPDESRVYTQQINYIYDQGKIIEWEKRSIDGSLLSKHIYKYDANGELSEDITNNAEGQPVWRTTYKYDSAGNIVEEIIYDRNQEFFTSKVVSTYDAANRLLKQMHYGRDNILDGRKEYLYKSDGTEREETSYDKNGLLIVKDTTRYDKRHNITEITYSYSRNPILIGTYSSSYEYDSLGNWIKNVELIHGEPNEVTYRTIKYFGQPPPSP